MGAAVKFKVASVPRQQGERARLKVVRGPDYGAIFVVTGNRATIGRGEDNDIVVSDLKSSRQHAEVYWTGTGWAVKDLGSANGILHNGAHVRAANLSPVRDSITIGETTLEFFPGEAGTLALVAPPRDAAVVEGEQRAFEEQRKKVRALGGLGAGMAPAPAIKKPSTPQQGRSKLMMIAAGLVVAVLVMLNGGDEEDANKAAKAKKAKQQQKADDLDRYLPTGEPDAQTKSAEIFFKGGFREYNQGNYLRAKIQFETALQISPSHAMASLYLRNCENRIKEEVETRLRKGKKAFNAGKLREARGHFEQTLRLLYRDQTNPHFVEAKEQLELVNKQIKGGEN